MVLFSELHFFFRILEQKYGGYVLNFHFVIDTISAVLYFLCCMLCLFRLSDSDDVLAALYLAADILQKKTSGKKKTEKTKSYCCFCSLERDRTPQKCQQIHSCSKTTEEKRKKVHKSDACWPPNVAKLCRACVSSLIFNSGHISDVT